MSEGEIDPVANSVSGRKIADQMTEDAETVEKTVPRYLRG